MKKFVRSSALIACAVLSFSISMSSSARAEQGDMVRMSQMRLADLGYYSGADDGVLGPITSIALRDFQAYNRLPVTGSLNAETFNLLMAADFRIHHGAIVAPVAYTGMPYMAPVAAPIATPVSYFGGGYAQYVAAPTLTHVAYYEDGNGYSHYAASPTSLPVAWGGPAAPIATTPVAYTPNYGTYGYVDAAWHY